MSSFTDKSLKTVRISQVMRDAKGKRFGAHGWFSKFNVAQTDRGFDTTGAFFSSWMETLCSLPHANFGGSWFIPVLRCTGAHHLSAEVRYSFLSCVLINLCSHWGERQTSIMKKSYKVRCFCLVACPKNKRKWWEDVCGLENEDLLCNPHLQKLQYLGNNR